MGELFESGIRALTSLSFQIQPCNNCAKGKLHSPFYCAEYYEQADREKDRHFTIPSIMPPKVREWLEKNKDTENGITEMEIERYRNHYAHRMSHSEWLMQRAMKMESILQEFDVLADVMNLPKDDNMRMRVGAIRNFEIPDLMAGKEPEYHHSENVWDCIYILNQLRERAYYTIEYHSRDPQSKVSKKWLAKLSIFARKGSL